MGDYYYITKPKLNFILPDQTWTTMDDLRKELKSTELSRDTTLALSFPEESVQYNFLQNATRGRECQVWVSQEQERYDIFQARKESYSLRHEKRTKSKERFTDPSVYT